MLALLVVMAIAWGWQQADGGSDGFRIVLGLGMGLVVAAAMRVADGALSGRLDFGTLSAVASAAMVVGPVIGVLAAAVVARQGGLDDNLGVTDGRRVCRSARGPGMLYPIE